MISSINVASIKPEVSQLFRCLLISLRLSDSDKNFFTICITVVLLFFFFWLLLVQFAHHVPLQVEGRIECFRAFTTQMFVSHPHFFSLTKVPKQQLMSPFLLAHSCTRFPCYLGMEIQHRVETSYRGGGRLQTVLQGPRLTKSSAFFCKSHLLISIPSWKIKNYHPKTLFRPQKRSIFLGFHEFPKKRVAISNPHFRKFTNF